MKAIQVIEKGNQRVFNMDAEKLIGVSTKSLYIRKGFKNGTLFISQRGNGAGGAGDVCILDCVNLVDVKSNLFDRLKIYAEKAGAII
jgi:hypothetical protein